MALGAMVKVQDAGKSASTPLYADQITIVGDGAYPAGGSPGFLALFRAAMGNTRTIVALVDMSDPATLSTLEYDVANDKLFARVRTTGVESGVANQSAVTYRVCVISY